jgi:predicted nucleic acid-binding protein
MHDLFVDTSGWAAYLVQSQPSHARAATRVRQTRRTRGRLVTTQLILYELVALLTSPIRLSRPLQIRYLAIVRNAPWVDVVPNDATLDAAAWQVWESRPDKEWSLVDCASFVVRQQRGLTEALTSDHHFEQSGFVRLLK